MPRIIDLHCDTVSELQAGIDLPGGSASGHVDLPRLRAGNVYAQVFACFVSSEVPRNAAFSHAGEMIGRVHGLCGSHPEHFRLVRSAAGFASDRINILIAVENGYAIENDLRNLASLKEQGVCYMTLTHSKHLSWAASSGDRDDRAGGLNTFGKKVIGAMNEMGMIIDVSHVHDTTFWDVIRLTRRPVIASHSNCRAICSTPRNLSDDQIRAIAGIGGMIGVNFFPGFLDGRYAGGLKAHCSDLFGELDRIETAFMTDPAGKSAALRAFGGALRQRMRHFSVPPDRIIDHVCHIADLTGPDHVGFGSDFDGVPALPDGISGSDCYPHLIRILRERGFSDADIDKIAGANFLRVLKDNLF